MFSFICLKFCNWEGNCEILFIIVNTHIPETLYFKDLNIIVTGGHTQKRRRHQTSNSYQNIVYKPIHVLGHHGHSGEIDMGH